MCVYISNVDKTIIIEEKWIGEESVGDMDALDSHVKF